MHELQSALIDPLFANLSEAVDYLASGQRAQAVRGILISNSQVVSSGGYPELRPVIHVRASELTKPLLGATLRTATEQWVIDRPPELKDGVWAIVVRKIT
jgi:hypothetical protein